MHFTHFLFAAQALATPALAYPGMETLLHDIQQSHFHRRQDDEFDGTDSTELIGDLLTLKDEELTRVGLNIKNILIGAIAAQSNAGWPDGFVVPGLGTAECAADTCCVWQYVADEMEDVFRGRSGRCTDLARGAIRLGFHDAGGFSKATAPGGGADGSIILAPDERLRTENNGLQTIIGKMEEWYAKYSPYGITMADLIQFGANVAVVVCPLGPRTRTFVGRADNSSAAPHGLLPDVNSNSSTLIELFRNKTIGPHGLVALVGAHTTSQQFHQDLNRTGDPQDSTPGVWDVLFYSQTLERDIEGAVPPRVFTFASDVALAAAPETGDEWFRFAYEVDRQEDWNEDYAREYTRLSMLSVYQINSMTECTQVLPMAVTNFTAIDETTVNKWCNSTVELLEVAEAVHNGSIVTPAELGNLSVVPLL